MISIVIPVRDQAGFISRIVDRYEDGLRRIGEEHEVILVENGSADSTASECSKLVARYPTVRFVQAPRPGWGAAVRLGLSIATGHLLCYTNSARTSAEDLSLLLLYARANPGAVIKANRKIRDSGLRRAGSLLYNLECRAFFDLAQWDINGTPKVFPRECSTLLKLEREDDLIDLEFNVACKRAGYPMIEVPILAATRHGGRSTTNYRTAFSLYLGAYRYWRSLTRP